MKRILLIIFPLLFTSHLIAQEVPSFTYNEVIYGRKDGLALTLFVLKPQKSNGKGIVSLVSGGWNSSNSAAQDLYLKGTYPFLNKGYTVFLTIHGSNPRFTIPDALQDIQRSVQFIRYNAKTYSIDPDNIGITGTSSGGHLSLLAATSTDAQNEKSQDPISRVSSRVQAVIAFCPLTDFLNFGGDGLHISRIKEQIQQMGVWGAFNYLRFDSKTKTYLPVENNMERRTIDSLMSPVQLINKNSPPVYLLHGDNDRTVPIQQSKSFVDKYKLMSLEAEFVIKKGKDHNLIGSEDDFLNIFSWLDKKLKLI